jgi:hypothetical protein
MPRQNLWQEVRLSLAKPPPQQHELARPRPNNFQHSAPKTAPCQTHLDLGRDRAFCSLQQPFFARKLPHRRRERPGRSPRQQNSKKVLKTRQIWEALGKEAHKLA